MPRKRLDQLFHEHIKLGHNVACIGANDSGYTGDPSPLYALSRVGKNGAVWVVDAQSARARERLLAMDAKATKATSQSRIKRAFAYLAKLKSKSMGTGEPLIYKAQVDKLRQSGFQWQRITDGLDVPRLQVHLANATKTAFSRKKMDVVVDVGSLPFIIDQDHLAKHDGDNLLRPEKLLPVLKEYKRIGKKTILVFRSHNDISVVKEVLASLKAKKVEEVPISNKYEFVVQRKPRKNPLPRLSAEHDAPKGRLFELRHHGKMDRALIVTWHSKQTH